MSDNRNRFVIGIDYGTTYSGAAYLFVDPEKDPDYSKIKVIQSWPGDGGGIDNCSNDKVPTEISYDDGQILWGYEIPQCATRYSCFKLLLDKRASETAYDDPNLPDVAEDISLPDGKTVHQVTFEYLKLLYTHVIKHIRELVPLTFDSTPIQFILTVPAIWSHAAQRTTIDAAKRAGFGSRDGDTIAMVSEPEAAGAYCLSEMNSGSGNELKEGERILICDAGGGTVDLATYEVSELTPCLRVREVVAGSGGKCGSTVINRAFLKWLTPLLVQDQKKKTRPIQTGPGSNIMKQFESVKRAFGSSDRAKSSSITLGRVEDDEANGIESGELELTRDRMGQFFDPIVKMVIDLVAQQIKDSNEKDDQKRVSKILLVGGFAASRYLRRKLNDWCQSQPFAVDVIIPQNTWTAVARGAVIHGIKSLVDSRRLKEHYGVILGAPFDPRSYDIDTTYFDPIHGCFMTLDHVEWFAAKGQEAVNGQHFPICGSSTFPEWLDGRELIVEIVTSRSEAAPVSAQRGKVQRVGRVEADLSSVPESAYNVECRSCKRCGERKILHADISVEMSVASADLKFEVVFEGESYGSTRIEYHHDGESDTPPSDLGRNTLINLAQLANT